MNRKEKQTNNLRKGKNVWTEKRDDWDSGMGFKGMH